MSDNKSKKGSPDNKRINTSQPYEVAYWTQKWGISRQQLVGAKIATSSTNVEKIEGYLKRKGVL